MQVSTEKRYRKVLGSNSEVAHVWAQRTQPEGRSSHNNVFFKGDSIYSYGFHFKIAQFIEKAGQVVVIFNANGYSSSTGKHKGLVNRAISQYSTFTVPELPYYDTFSQVDHEKNLKYYTSKANEHIEKAARSRKYADYELGSAIRFIDELNKYATFFELEMNDEQKELVRRMNAGELLNDEQKDLLRSKFEANRKAVIEEKKNDIAEWLAGERYSLTQKIDMIYLRRKGDIVETSLGANVPALEARLLYRSIKGGKDVKGARIGSYTVIGFNGKILTIGCHKLEVTEINRFAASQNW